MSDILVPIQVILKLFIMANEFLGYWVQGNALTVPDGESFVESLAVIVHIGANTIATLLGLV